MKVIMTCGGTGGHIYPALAIADEIKKRKPDAEIIFVGSEIGLEKDMVPENGYKIELISADGFNRQHLLKNFEVLRKLRRGSRKSREILREFKPDVVIGTGGYASAPIVKAAQKMNIPTFIHEQNAVPGMANKMLEKHVRNLFLGFGDASKYFRYPQKHIVSGNPVRQVFKDAGREESRAELGYGPDDFVLLAFGGSQGAERVNKAMTGIIEAFSGAENIRICLATGSYYYEKITQQLHEKGIDTSGNVEIKEYIYDMAKYLSAADLVICRSGALSVAEATVCGVPAIFIPSPLVTGNHQYFNAKAVADKGGAIIIEEKDLDNEGLVQKISELRADPQTLKKMTENSYSCAPLDATEIIYENIMKSINRE